MQYGKQKIKIIDNALIDVIIIVCVTDAHYKI